MNNYSKGLRYKSIDAYSCEVVGKGLCSQKEMEKKQ